jgi:hypothetical protein
MTPPTQEQLADALIPHVTLTSDLPWDPSKYDEEATVEPDDETAGDGTPFELPMDPGYDTPLPVVPNGDREVYFNELQRQRHYEIDAGCDDEFAEFGEVPTDFTLDAVFQAVPNILEVMASACRTTYQAKKTWLENKYGKTIEELRPHFAFASADSIKATVEASTQMYLGNTEPLL